MARFDPAADIGAKFSLILDRNWMQLITVVPWNHTRDRHQSAVSRLPGHGGRHPGGLLRNRFHLGYPRS
jgi:hypothetical protein